MRIQIERENLKDEKMKKIANFLFAFIYLFENRIFIFYQDNRAINVWQ